MREATDEPPEIQLTICGPKFCGTKDWPEASDRAGTSASRERRPAAAGRAKKELNQTQLVIDRAEMGIPGFTPSGMPPTGDDPKTRHGISRVTPQERTSAYLARPRKSNEY
jgi:hypothetical protein